MFDESKWLERDSVDHLANCTDRRRRARNLAIDTAIVEPSDAN